MMHVRWRDRREVNMLTTFHKNEFVASGKTDKSGEKLIPKCVQEYNQYMGVVDKTDMRAESCQVVQEIIFSYPGLVTFECTYCLQDCNW